VAFTNRHPFEELPATVARLAPSWCTRTVAAVPGSEDPRNALATSKFAEYLENALKRGEAAAATPPAPAATPTAPADTKSDFIGDSLRKRFSTGVTPSSTYRACQYWGVVITAQFLAGTLDDEAAVGSIEAALAGCTANDLCTVFSMTLKNEPYTEGMILSDWRSRLSGFVAKVSKLKDYPRTKENAEMCAAFAAGLAAGSKR
jgi:hypothetical protein